MVKNVAKVFHGTKRDTGNAGSFFADRSRYSPFRGGLAIAALAASLWPWQPSLARDLKYVPMASSTVPTNTPQAGAMGATAQAAEVAQRARESMRRSMEVIRSLEAAQAAARAAALSGASPIPNGLVTGGLKPKPGAEVPGSELWQGALLPTQEQIADRTKVTIGQTASKAILTWETFNVGRETDLAFNQQGNRDWVALNRVDDPYARPSQILGTITAEGQVYIINRNGIIFAGSSQVNTRSLIASTANILDDQFLNRGIYSAQSGSGYTAVFTDAASLLGLTPDGGKIKVEAGAILETFAPQSVTTGGGFVMLLGGEVKNEGTILTPKGQALLAAGDAFVFRPGYGTEVNQASTTRGSEVAPVIASNSLAGTVRNSGLIFSQQGDITLAGRAVQQSGVLLSTTSVNQRGTIHLLNAASDTAGSISLESGSVTTVIPELESEDTALNSQRDSLIAASETANVQRSAAASGAFNNLSLLADRLDQSRIEIVTGGDVTFKDGSVTQAQGGQVAVSAGSRLLTEGGSIVDVSGTRDAHVAMSANNITVNVQGNELRDSPVNRDADYLKNENVWIDVRDLVFVPSGTGGYEGDRYYTGGGLLEVGGYLSNQAHRIGEWTAVGGTITLSAPEVIAQQGSVFDISGGAVTYEGGVIRTTNFLGADGRLYNINSAPADMLFYGVGHGFIRRHEHWGVTEVWMSPLGWGRETVRYEPGYTVGRDAGRLVLATPTAVMQGDILAGVINGARQTDAAVDGVDDGYRFGQDTVARSGSLVIARPQPGSDQWMILPDWRSTGGQVTFSNGDAPQDITTGQTWLNADQINSFGLGELIVVADGVTVKDDLVLTDGGRFDLTAEAIDIHAGLTVRSGDVSLRDSNNEYNYWQGQPLTGRLTLHEGASIDTRGVWTNLALDPAGITGLSHVDGGDVLIRAGTVQMEGGSSIDASSGAALLQSGDLLGGAGGDISLISTGELSLGGSLISRGFTRGGALALQSGGLIQVVGEPRFVGNRMTLEPGEGAPSDVQVTLDEDVIIAAGETLPFPFTFTEERRLMPGDTVTQEFSNYYSQHVAWTVPGYPAEVYDAITFDQIPAGQTIAPGREVYLYLPWGAVITAESFPNGLSLGTSQTHVPAGGVALEDVTFSAGMGVPGGTTFDRPVRLANAAPELTPDFFGQGFSSYEITGLGGVSVADGVSIDAVQPVYREFLEGEDPARITARRRALRNLESGSDIDGAFEFGLPPLYVDDAINGVSTQRAGADVILRGGRYLDAPVTRPGTGPTGSGGAVRIGEGASIRVDDGGAIHLLANTLDVEGALIAHGGEISLRNSGTGRITVADTAVLDTSARAHTATDARGRLYSVVPAGGLILIGGAGVLPGDKYPQYESVSSTILVEPGARLDVSGAAAEIDLILADGQSRRVLAASDGGRINFNSLASKAGNILANITIAGDLMAHAGGEGALGGTLEIISEAPMVAGNPGQNPVFNGSRTVFLSAARNEDGSLPSSNATISAEQIQAGGFDSLKIFARSAVVFDGDINLSLGRSLELSTGQIANYQANAAVTLSAPYVLLGGRQQVLGHAYPGRIDTGFGGVTYGGAHLTITADLLDIQNDAGSTTYETTELVSRGDLRLLPTLHWMGLSNDVRAIAPTTFAGRANGELVIRAAQIYPGTNANATLSVAGLNGRLTILGWEGQETPVVPYSAFGFLTLSAETIHQGGVVRAPLGGLIFRSTNDEPIHSRVYFAPGSLTSVSGAGLTTLYGGTSDGVSYSVDGLSPMIAGLHTGQFLNLSSDDRRLGIEVLASNIDAAEGSVLDVSGGGKLLGAGFLQGRGGSVDVLTTALVNANPLYSFSQSGNEVFAIVPGATTTATAGNSSTQWTGATPAAGRQITIPEGVPGLPAGTYTLMPASYALLPGAFRVEIGSQGRVDTGVADLGSGVYHVSGYQGLANTAGRDALPTPMVIMSGETAATYSLFNRTSYADYALSQTALFGQPRPLLEGDGRFLQLLHLGRHPNFNDNQIKMSLKFDGAANFAGVEGHYDGSLVIMSTGYDSDIIVTAGDTPEDRRTDVLYFTQDALDNLNASNIYIGGRPKSQIRGNLSQNQPPHTFPFIELGYNNINSGRVRSVTVESGVKIEAGHLVLFAGGNPTSYGFAPASIVVESGAVLTSLGQGVTAPDSRFGGYQYTPWTQEGGYQPAQSALLAVSNGWLDFTTTAGANRSTLVVEDGAQIYSDGTLGFVAGRGVDFQGDELRMGGRYLTFAVPTINIGTEAALAGSNVPAGLKFTQAFLDRLLAGDPTSGAPATESLTLRASESFNVFGSAVIDATLAGSRLEELVLSAPALYGAGEAGDEAVFRTNRLVWSGITTMVGNDTGSAQNPYGNAFEETSVTPGAITPGGPGTGAGRLRFEVAELVLGYPERSHTDAQTPGDRLVLGFSSVDIHASKRVISNRNSSLNVYQSGPSPDADYDPATYEGVGGTLNIVSPLVVADGGSRVAYRVGGALSVTAPAGVTAPAVNADHLGGSLYFEADSIFIDTAVAAPSGLISLAAVNDLALGDNSLLDVSGRTVNFYDQERYTWGGDVRLDSAKGGIDQALGGIIDVSAPGSDAGRLLASATDASAGSVWLHGQLKGRGGDGFGGGVIDVRAQRIGEEAANLSADFAALNARLDEAGFNGGRSFQLKQGDLTLAAGSVLRADNVILSIDGGSLTVDGTINASGDVPGSIRLAARDFLKIGAGATLDVHGTELQTDGYGEAIEASNRGYIELAAREGRLTLLDGATFDLSSPDDVARGQMVLMAPRLGSTVAGATGAGAPANATGDDIAIDAGGTLDIRGAGRIAVYGVARYADAPVDPDNSDGQVIDQAYLDLIDQDSTVFIDGALANADLQRRLAGLKAYEDAYHLRPGVEIVSATIDGDLRVNGNLVLAGYRYGPDANRDVESPTFGAGEPMRLTLAAGGDLTVNGSITDGFAPQRGSEEFQELYTVPSGGYLVERGGTLLGNTTGSSWDNPPSTLPGGAAQNYTLPFNASLRAGTSVRNGLPIPFEFWANSSISVPAWVFNRGGWVLSAPVTVSGSGISAASFSTTANRRIVLPNGTIYTRTNPVPGNTVLPAGTAIFPGTTTAAGTAGVTWYIPLTGARFAAGSTLPSGSPTFLSGSTAISGGSTSNTPIIVPAGTNFNLFSSTVTLAANISVPAGTRLPSGARIRGSFVLNAFSPNVVGGDMLAAGSQSADIRLAAGADLTAADSRALRAVSALNGVGDLVLSNRRTTEPNPNTGMSSVLTSVVRTGTGSLDILAGDDLIWNSFFGVYTAGSQTTTPEGFTGTVGDGVYFPDHGGDLLAVAQGDLVGYNYFADFGWPNDYAAMTVDTGLRTWLQHSSGATPEGRYLGINFGSKGASGFNGLGALGGGNATILVGGDAGNLDRVLYQNSDVLFSNALTFAVGNTLRVTNVTRIGGEVVEGELVQTGGGDLTVRIAGRFNAGDSRIGAATRDQRPAEISGIFVTARGDMLVQAASIGTAKLTYGAALNHDPRKESPYEAQVSDSAGGPLMVLGDARAEWRSGGDLVFGRFEDAGMDRNDTYVDNSATGFLLHTERTSIDLLTVGGHAVPYDDRLTRRAMLPSQFRVMAANGNIYNYTFDVTASLGQYYNPLNLLPSANGQLELLARGSILSSGSAWLMSSIDPKLLLTPLVDAAPANGRWPQIGNMGNMLFYTTLDQNTVMSLGQPTALHTGAADPIRFYAVEGDIVNLQTGTRLHGNILPGGFYPIDVWYGAAKRVSIQAGRDIVNLGALPTAHGNAAVAAMYGGLIMNLDPTDVSLVSAGRDILYVGLQVGGPGTLEITAGRHFYQGDGGNVGQITGSSPQFYDRGAVISSGDVLSNYTRPGADIVVHAGMAEGVDWHGFLDLYLTPANQADPERPLGDQNVVDDKGIVQKVQHVLTTYGGELTLAQWLAQEFGYVGGEAGAQAYLNARSAEAPQRDLAGEYRAAGSVYLVNWLRDRYGFSGTPEEARARFDALAPEQQRILARNIYYHELREGGREYNNPASGRLGSYLRGRLAIAALFPDRYDDGTEILRSGDVTLFSGYVRDAANRAIYSASGLRTHFGGDIQVMAPGGWIVVGAERVTPPASAGIVTQGSGDIQIYSKGSILLGLSRIMTTFGGDILAWSAEGDINAGRGAKTTLLYPPARRVYDAYGNVTLSPTVPSSGAGIATLNPIREVPAGDIDLIAPLGTIDAGEAGIRVSGNVNLAALQVVNAANIQAQGTTNGIPTVDVPNISALTSAGAIAAGATQAAAPERKTDSRSSIIIVEILGYGGGDGLAPGDCSGHECEKRGSRRPGDTAANANEASPVKILGAGALPEASKRVLSVEERKRLVH